VKIVLDTNVFVSGIFFGGPPGAILEAWQDRRIELVVSLEILAEYERVGKELAAQFPEVDLSSFLELIVSNAELCDCPPLTEPGVRGCGRR
jgi:putative PIN family toxin of toxin-antitoxin system